MKLRQVASGWEFESEKDLEDLVWSNLEKLFGYKPLKRQYQVSGQYCDILAFGKNKELVIIELKNSEDRYIVQQLTRYYDALLDEKPFPEHINFQVPVVLIAVTPNFHRDNYTDRKYHQLKFNFLQFKIICQEQKFSLNIINVDTTLNWKLDFDYSPENHVNINIPIAHKRFYQLIGKCTHQERSKLLKFRETILQFDDRMQEIVQDGGIYYGKGKTKYCAELRLNSKKELVLFLWLPRNFLWGTQDNIYRFRIWTDWNNAAIVRPASKGLGKITATDIEFAKQNSKNQSLDTFLYHALNKWFQRI
jgi:RecB family endonuclease NucS